MLRFAPLLLLALSACSLAGPSDADIEAARAPEADGVVVNRTSADVIFWAIESRLAATVNLSFPENEPVSDPSVIVRSGEAAPLDVGNYEPGDDFIVYVLRVRGNRVSYGGSLQVDGEAFADDDAILTVRRF